VGKRIGVELMPADVTIPSMGVAMESAILLTWLKQEGDSVEANQPIAEIETDKSTVELLAPTPGRLGPHLYEEGDEIPVGETVVAILADGEAPGDAPSAPLRRSPSPHPQGDLPCPAVTTVPLASESRDGTARGHGGWRPKPRKRPRRKLLRNRRPAADFAISSPKE
jgi:dihydrolipoamide dehydrogenase